MVAIPTLVSEPVASVGGVGETSYPDLYRRRVSSLTSDSAADLSQVRQAPLQRHFRSLCLKGVEMLPLKTPHQAGSHRPETQKNAR